MNIFISPVRQHTVIHKLQYCRATTSGILIDLMLVELCGTDTKNS